jgi:replicative DNA helicase
MTADSRDPIPSLAAELRASTLDLNARRIATEFQDLVDADTSCEAIRKMRDKINELLSEAEHTEESTLKDVVQHATDHYAGAKNGSIYGIPWPWDCLTNDTLGKRPGNLIVMYSRPKTMKCVCEGQKIMTSSGNLVPIEELPDITEVPSYTKKSRRMRFAKARKVVSGTKPSVEVRTKSGLCLRTGDEHLYMVPGGGYKRIKDLSPGDYVATVRCLPDWNPSEKALSAEDAHFLGLLMGDGNYTRNEVQFTSADKDIVQSIERHAGRYGCLLKQGGRPIEYRIVAGEGRKGANAVLNWLREIGVHGKKSIDKEVPQCILESSPDAIAAFLAGLMDTDGSIADRHTNVYWSTSSEKLSHGIQHLLMRFGLRGRISETLTGYKPGNKSYPVYVYDHEQLCRLCNILIPYMVLTRKKESLEKIFLPMERDNRSRDTIPYRKDLEEAILHAKEGHEWPKMGDSYYDKTKLFKYKNRISRWRLSELADAFNSDELRKEADTDIFWDQVKSIEPLGEVPCYDICIEDGLDPNFAVEGFIVHNTWIMLYCAVYDYLVNNCRVLVWSREMTKEDLCLRLASILAKVDYQLFKKGKLPPQKAKEAFATLNSLLRQEEDLDSKDMKDGASKGNRHLLVLAGRHAPKDTATFQVVLDKYQPTIAYLDSFYHMDPAGASAKLQRWERLAKLSETIKCMGQDNSIPIVAVHQANRLGEKTHGNTLSDLADSDVLAREADLIIRVLKRRGRELYEEGYEVIQPEVVEQAKVFRKKGPELAKEASVIEDIAPRMGAELALVMGGNREGILEAFTLHAVPGYNFSLISSDYSTSEIAQWLKEDEEEKPVKAAPRPEDKPSSTPKFNRDTFKQYIKSN